MSNLLQSLLDSKQSSLGERDKNSLLILTSTLKFLPHLFTCTAVNRDFPSNFPSEDFVINGIGSQMV